MEVVKKIYKIFKWFVFIVLIFIVLLGLIGFIANKFFDNAAMKDACADSGGAWDYQKDQCQFGPNDPRNKK
ncbi:OadG family protein [Acinetobacter sp. V102_4]|uniref:OadG family protein n=1 Tax=Acinetobacter sp. V102_4 TaxID=3072984 RepID=UPI00287C5B94|nr:OadG family protein [Acinetobacter sp. V102_4]MDS7928649.1 OadG family protein [Acinetobacter sp. V102_4]